MPLVGRMADRRLRKSWLRWLGGRTSLARRGNSLLRLADGWHRLALGGQNRRHGGFGFHSPRPPTHEMLDGDFGLGGRLTGNGHRALTPDGGHRRLGHTRHGGGHRRFGGHLPAGYRTCRHTRSGRDRPLLSLLDLSGRSAASDRPMHRTLPHSLGCVLQAGNGLHASGRRGHTRRCLAR